jgi:tRNA-specific 2-thiouridylase
MARTLFPLAEYTKPEVRQMAYDRGFTDLSKKGDSYEICFVPDNDYRSFLKRRVDGLEEEVRGGHFVDTEGNVIGEHEGYPFYTIGQRRGLGKAFGEPKYVTHIQPETNTVVLGDVEDLMKNSMRVGQLNWQKVPAIENPREVSTMVRYNSFATLSTIELLGDTVRVDFHANVKGIAPGQSAVFYDGDDVIGGGVIQRNESFL